MNLPAIAHWIAMAVSEPGNHLGTWVMVGSIGSIASAVILLVAAIVAAGQLREAQQLRAGQTRPFVVIEFHTLGSTMARDIRFKFDRPLKSRIGNGTFDPMNLQVFTTGISSLPPGRVMEFLFDSWIGRPDSDDRYVVEVEYRGDGHQRYREDIDLDLGAFRNMLFVSRHGLHEIHDELKGIADSLKSFRATPGDGFLTVTRRRAALELNPRGDEQATIRSQRRSCASRATRPGPRPSSEQPSGPSRASRRSKPPK